MRSSKRVAGSPKTLISLGVLPGSPWSPIDLPSTCQVAPSLYDTYHLLSVILSIGLIPSSPSLPSRPFRPSVPGRPSGPLSPVAWPISFHEDWLSIESIQRPFSIRR